VLRKGRGACCNRLGFKVGDDGDPTRAARLLVPENGID